MELSTTKLKEVEYCKLCSKEAWYKYRLILTSVVLCTDCAGLLMVQEFNRLGDIKKATETN